MILTLVLGSLSGIFFIVLAVMLSTDNPMIFFNIPGLILVAGGCFAALFAGYPGKEIKAALRAVKTLGHPDHLNDVQQIDELVQFARDYSRNDVRKIEARLHQHINPFLAMGMQMIIAKLPVADVAGTLAWRIKRLKAREQAEARIFHALSSYAPAFGMVGTLLGLVNMMLVLDAKNLDLMGGHLAIALVTTFYGLLLSNLFFKPIATKLERRTEKRLLHMSLILEGLTLIGLGRSPAFIRESLYSFVTHYDDELGARHSTKHTGHSDSESAHATLP
ncbi:motility protein A [Allohahella marinimesophila]|uniref:MotA/TolQ/ExbB proton channel family protein n=1 Tax=Allohahella marinimesophila TaxID=1054972 RepID=A0ABP7Q4R8_9GAMM